MLVKNLGQLLMQNPDLIADQDFNKCSHCVFNFAGRISNFFISSIDFALKSWFRQGDQLYPLDLLKVRPL